jgi:non-canonical purine NTP pyrophosphatase, rdgB/HAM1 family
MKRIVIATNNKNKVREIREILKDTAIEVVSQGELEIDVDVVEDGTTFEENAYKKAAEIMKIAGLPTLADDSGLEVDALNGAPGVYSARFAGVHGDNAKNNEKLLELMKDVPEDKRGARFVTAMVLIFPDIKSIKTRGEIKGIIGWEPKGSNGFGYDPLFIVPELGKTFAELDGMEKNSISHRGRALREMKTRLVESIQEGRDF